MTKWKKILIIIAKDHSRFYIQCKKTLWTIFLNGFSSIVWTVHDPLINRMTNGRLSVRFAFLSWFLTSIIDRINRFVKIMLKIVAKK